MRTEKDTFLNVYKDIYTFGKESSPRGQKILELEDYKFTLQPYDRFTSFRPRKMSLAYIKAELIWYLRANPYDTMIIDKAQMWKDIQQPSGKFFSNYGQYIFGEQNGAQFVIDELLHDCDSRRAVIPLLNAGHLFHENKDVVCTYSISFRIRDSKLNMSVNMRSNDAIWGMTNDVACFSFIHEIIFAMLRIHMPSIELGTYTHKADSLHVYKRHFEMLKLLAIEGEKHYYKIDVPKISSHREVKSLIELLRFNTPYPKDMTKEDTRFSKWLVQ